MERCDGGELFTLLESMEFSDEGVRSLVCGEGQVYIYVHTHTHTHTHTQHTRFNMYITKLLGRGKAAADAARLRRK
jgi:hypothetical protein